MIKPLKFLCYCLILLLCAIPFILWAQAEVTVTESWTLNIGLSDLQGGPGSPLNDTYESMMDQIIIDIKGKKVKDWILYVRRNDNIWNSDFQLNIRRTDDGVGSGNILGDTTIKRFQLLILNSTGEGKIEGMWIHNSS